MRYVIDKDNLEEIREKLNTYVVYIDNEPTDVLVTAVGDVDRIKREAAYHGRYVDYSEIDKRVKVRRLVEFRPQLSEDGYISVNNLTRNGYGVTPVFNLAEFNRPDWTESYVYFTVSDACLESDYRDKIGKAP